jgi:hypothetical protein
MEQLVLQAAKVRFMFGGKASAPFVLRMAGGSGTGAAAQHSESLEAWFVHVPGLRVVMPATPYDAKGLLLTSIYDGNPVMFVENKLLYKTRGPVPEEMYRVPLGEAKSCAWARRRSWQPPSWSRAPQAANGGRGIEVELIDRARSNPWTRLHLRFGGENRPAARCPRAPETGGFGVVVARVASSRSFVTWKPRSAGCRVGYRITPGIPAVPSG